MLIDLCCSCPWLWVYLGEMSLTKSWQCLSIGIISDCTTAATTTKKTKKQKMHRSSQALKNSWLSCTHILYPHTSLTWQSLCMASTKGTISSSPAVSVRAASRAGPRESRWGQFCQWRTIRTLTILCRAQPLDRSLLIPVKRDGTAPWFEGLAASPNVVGVTPLEGRVHSLWANRPSAL